MTGSFAAIKNSLTASLFRDGVSMYKSMSKMPNILGSVYTGPAKRNVLDKIVPFLENDIQVELWTEIKINVSNARPNTCMIAMLLL